MYPTNYPLSYFAFTRFFCSLFFSCSRKPRLRAKIRNLSLARPGNEALPIFRSPRQNEKVARGKKMYRDQGKALKHQISCELCFSHRLKFTRVTIHLKQNTTNGSVIWDLSRIWSPLPCFRFRSTLFINGTEKGRIIFLAPL